MFNFAENKQSRSMFRYENINIILPIGTKGLIRTNSFSKYRVFVYELYNEDKRTTANIV